MKRLLVVFFVLFSSLMIYAADIPIRNNKNVLMGKLRFVSGTTYNIYDTKGNKIGTYKATMKLTTTYMKGRKFKLVKVGTTYTIKE